jgi:hypothetical protein
MPLIVLALELNFRNPKLEFKLCASSIPKKKKRRRREREREREKRKKTVC